MVWIAITAGCSGAAKPAIDGGGPPPDVFVPMSCPPLPGAATFDFFGDACTSAPFPANTECRGGAGWCITNVCRPQSSLPNTTCPACPAGTEHFAPAGAGYCAPG